jgi:hypothetical protein
MTKRLTFFLLILLTYQLSRGQINLDSCGVDSKPVLNQYEITIIDSMFLPPYATKKEVIDPKKGFDLKDKKIAFYSCTESSNTKGDGFLSKKEFFQLSRLNFKGHAGRGIIIFNEMEKKESKGFDAVIIIDCPYDNLTKKDLILKLATKYE